MTGQDWTVHRLNDQFTPNEVLVFSVPNSQSKLKLTKTQNNNLSINKL